jgi:type VI secretion system protein VasG
MATISPRVLVSKLNAICKRSLEGAAGLCQSRTHYILELEHWFLKLFETADSDLPKLARQYDGDLNRIHRELSKALDGFKTGNSRAPEMSAELQELMTEAWPIASLAYGAAGIRSGHLLVALARNRFLATRFRNNYPEFSKLLQDRVAEELATVTADTGEANQASTPQVSPGSAAGSPLSSASKTPALDQFTADLTARARDGKIDPVIGRDAEMQQLVSILARRRQNNPILIGEAGVGKTAVVEGFANMIAQGLVPDALKTISVRSLDLGLLQAGAGVKGEFENRIKGVISEVQSSPTPIVLFIDEAHTLIGAGGAAGQNDAANLLKPALARGELRTIAATTFAEYKQYFSDAAMQRRFQPISVGEPSRPIAVAMLRGLCASLEKHHNVRISHQALDEAVRLSMRYITDRQLPDKAISVLDTACARVTLSQSALPAAIQDCRQQLQILDSEIAIKKRETNLGINHADSLTDLSQRREAQQSTHNALEAQWKQEKTIVEKILTAYTALTDEKTPAADSQKHKEELDRLHAELLKIQGEAPLVFPTVNDQAVAEVVARWTGIPLGKMVRNEMEAIMKLGDRLRERVVGQDHALEKIAKRIQTARAGLIDPRRPVGVFLLVGTSGVGKTETAIALAEQLFGGDRGLVVINMSEYKEEHKISRLTGSAPGYKGYGEGGVLTEAVRRKPNCVLLLDEVEKADESVQEIFYQVFDKGVLQDDRGNNVDFKNTIILLTSNAGTDAIHKHWADPDTRPSAEGLVEILRPELLKAFKPALLGRLEVVPYLPLEEPVLRGIIAIQMKRVADRVKENYKARFTYDPAVTELILSRCREVESGARVVDQIINGTILPGMAQHLLGRLMEGTPIEAIELHIAPEGGFATRVMP